MLPTQLKQTSIFVSLLSGAKVRRIMGEIGAQERRMMDLPSYHCFFFISTEILPHLLTCIR